MIRWSDTGNHDDEESIETYKNLFAMRASEPAFTAGSVIWIDNDQPDSVLSFLRKIQNTEILVVINLSNRKCTRDDRSAGDELLCSRESADSGKDVVLALFRAYIR